MNLSIVPAFFDVFRKGSAVADDLRGPVKVGGMALSAVVGALALSINSLAKAAGYDIQIDQPTADAIGAVAAWVVGCLFHIATTDKLGLPAKSEPDSSVPDPGSRS
jgi:hypothetical protein